jgi:hypothetical protein
MLSKDKKPCTAIIICYGNERLNNYLDWFKTYLPKVNVGLYDEVDTSRDCVALAQCSEEVIH